MKWGFGIFSLLGVLLFGVPGFAEMHTLTLDQALVRAEAENRDIKIVEERLNELRALQGEALSQGLPHLTGNGSYQRTWRKPEIIINGMPFRMGTDNTYTASAQLNQLLFDGGKVFKAVKAAKTEVARGIENIKDAQQQVRFEVKNAFYEILYLDKMLGVLEQELQQLKSHENSIRRRFNEGMESDYTLMRQEVQVTNLEPQIIDAKRNRELLVNGLKVLLAIAPEDELHVSGSFDYRERSLPDLEGLVQQAEAARPDLQAQRYREKSLVENVGIERAGYWPQINLTSSWQWQGQSDDWKVGADERTDTLQSGVQLSWPIFDGLKTYSRVKQAKAQLLQQQYATRQMEDDVSKQVINSHQVLVRAKEALNSQIKSLNLARRATGIASERFEAGQMSQIELNDTITAQATAEQNYLRATFDCLIAEAALERAIGGEK